MAGSESAAAEPGVIERFLRTMVAHGWAAFEECLADEFTRVGPYGDTYTTSADYVAFRHGHRARSAVIAAATSALVRFRRILRVLW